MKKLILLLVLATQICSAAPKGAASDELLEESQKQFYKNDHDGALSTLKKYFSKVVTEPKEKAKTKLRFLAIAAMGRIYLQYKQDPKGAITWFEKMKSDPTLTSAESDILNGWIAAAKDWIALGKFPDTTSSEKELFEIGKKYYEAGLKKQKYPMDSAGTADFSIASSFLVPFTVHFDKSTNLSDALLMMGDMRRRLWTSNEFWSENYYLTEVIRRFPNTPNAIKAFEDLKEDVHFGYTGSSGDHTPPSWVSLLGVLRKMAYEKPGEPAVTLPSPSAKPVN